ncbi:MAG: glycosyltransferase family 4 protein [Nitrososphaerota archaeon]
MADKVRIIMAARSRPILDVGGGATYAFYLAETLKRLEYRDILEVIPYWGAPHISRLPQASTIAWPTNIIRRTVKNFIKQHSVFYSIYKRSEFAMHRRNVARLSGDQPVLVHAHDSHVAYALLERYPIVYTHHAKGSLATEVTTSGKRVDTTVLALWRSFDEAVFRGSAIIVFPSNGARKLAEEEYPILKRKRTIVIWTGIPDHFGPKVVNAEREKLIVSIAAHVPEKNVLACLEAFYIYLRNSTDDKQTKFVNVGAFGPETNRLIRFIYEKGLEGRVELCSQVAHGKVLDLLSRARVFIHMPTRVVFDLALLEAMSAGIPAVVSPEAGNVEMLGAGWPYYASQPALAAQYLLELNRNDNLWGLRSRDIRQRYEKEFTIEAMADKYVKLYLDVAHRTQR